MAMIEKYCSGFTPAGAPNDIDVADAVDYDAYHRAMLDNLPNRALDAVWNTIARANEYVDRQAPWKLAKDPARRAELDATLASLMRQLARQGVALTPFMPGKVMELFKQLGAPPKTRWSFDDTVDVTAWRVMKGEPLFPKPVVEAAEP
jgi:methionyl-tRNA synthetase